METDFKMNKLLLGFLYVCIIIFVITASVFVTSKQTNSHKITLGGEVINVAVADTSALQEQGLSGRSTLGQNEGMLFVFQKSFYYGFWMKDMLFPIDIIWFNDNRQVVDVWENAKPESFPEVHAPEASSRYVVEVPSGFYATHHLQKGSTFEFN